MMAFVSDLLGKRVADVNGEQVGRLEDLVASVRGDMPHPVISAIVVKRQGGQLVVPMSEVAVLIAPAVPAHQVRRGRDHATTRPSRISTWPATFSTSRSSTPTGCASCGSTTWSWPGSIGDFYVANVDIGGLGLLRRMGLARLAERLGARTGTEASRA